MGDSSSYEFPSRSAHFGEIAPSILEPKPTQLRLGPGLGPNRKSHTPLAGKDAIDKKRVSVRFELLPDRKPRWDRIGLSAAGQLATVGFLLLAPLIFPQPMQTALKFDVVDLMQPVTQIRISPPPTPPPQRIRPKVRLPEPKPVLPEPSKLSPRQQHVFLVPKPEAVKVRTVEAKPVELHPILEQTKIVVVTSQPKPPKEDVKVGTLSSGSPAPATVVAPANKVQTGGFGDPNGIPGAGNPNRAVNINQAGSPLQPAGPGYGNRKSTRLNSSHSQISYAVFCLKKKNTVRWA